MPRRKTDYAKLYTLRSDGRYQGYWRDEDGKRHCVNDRDPERLHARLRALEDRTPAPPTFREISEAWEARHVERVGYKTAETYTAPLRRIRERFGSVPAEDLTAAEIQSFLNDLGKQAFSRRSVQLHRDIISMTFDDAILQGVLRVNPCAAVSLPRGLPSSRREMPDEATVDTVRARTDAPFALFALICLYAGLRRGEVLALRWEDVDLENRLIYVSRSVEYVGNDARVKAPKTAAGTRTVPLLDPLAEILPPPGAGLIFPGKDDETPLTKSAFRKRWLKYCDAIGCEVTAHQLRHGFATILYEAGVRDKDAQELLGHASIQVTRDVYTHIRQRQREATVKALNAYLNPKPPASDGKDDGKNEESP